MPAASVWYPASHKRRRLRGRCAPLPVPGAALRAALGCLPGRRRPTPKRGAARPAPVLLLSLLPPSKASHCTAVGLLRQGQALQASVLADRGRRPWTCRGKSGARLDPTRRGRGLAGSVVAACPHAPRRTLRSAVGRTVFDWPGCVLPGTGGGAVLLPLTARRGGGAHGGGRPLAAARGCRLLRRFFFLLKQRNVILAGPRQGLASLRSVRTRTLDMA